jgi:hypothetical protein
MGIPPKIGRDFILDVPGAAAPKPAILGLNIMGGKEVVLKRGSMLILNRL